MTQHQPTQEHRERLVREVRAVQEHYREAFVADPSAFSDDTGMGFEVEMAYRPRWEFLWWQAADFLSQCGCPVISANFEQGSASLWATQEGLDRLTLGIETYDRGFAHEMLSAIASIKPYTPRSEPPCA